MKKLTYLLGMFLMASATLMTSCTKDDDDSTVTPDNSPLLNLKGGTGYVSTDQEVVSGETFTLGFIATPNATTEKKLTRFELTMVQNNEVQTVKDSVLDKVTNFNWDVDFTLTGVGEVKFTAKITDKDDETTTKTITITVKGNETPMDSEIKDQQFFNNLGTGNGAYDLVAQTAVASSEDADMQNDSQPGATTVIFHKGWKSETATRFVKANDFDYAAATVENAIATYEAGTELEVVNDVVEGDIFIAKLRGNDEYCVIKITEVKVEGNTKGENDDYIKFDIKK